MMDRESKQPIDYEATATERKRGYVARAAGAITAVATGILSGTKMLRRSLRTYLHDRLFGRDWTNGAVEAVVKGVAIGDMDTISGAVTRYRKFSDLPASLNGEAEDSVSNAIHLSGGTLRGDGPANKALRDIYSAHLRDEVKYLGESELQKLFAKELVASGNNTESSIFRDGFLKDAFTNFKRKLHVYEKDRNALIDTLQKKSFIDPVRARPSVDALHQELKKIERNHLSEHIDTIAEAQKSFTGETKDFEPLKAALRTLEEKRLAKRYKLFEEFEKEKLLNAHTTVHKFLEQEQKIHSNFQHYTDQAKKKLMDIPVFDEMIKSGHEAGRMGLRFRHAHDKKRLVGFATIIGSSIGYVAYRGVKSYLHRNNKGKDEEQTFQEGVTAGRAAALHEQPGLA